MNALTLHKLQALSKESTVLYVEDNLTLQKQMKKILDKIFLKVYMVQSGTDAMKICTKITPNLIISNLSEDDNSLFEMVMEISSSQTITKVMTLSELNDDVMLLQSLDTNIDFFLFKPLNIDKLITSLLSIVLKEKKQSIDPICLFTLEDIRQKSIDINFINSYKGIHIQYAGKIENINNDEIIVHTHTSQTIAINNQKQTILNINNQYILFDLLLANKQSNIVTLINPRFIKYNPRDNKSKRIIVDKSFKIGLRYKSESISSICEDISMKSVAVYIKNKSLPLSIDDEVDLTFGFDEKSASSMINQKKFTTIFGNGTVTIVEPYQEGYRVVIKLSIQKSGERTFHNYLQQREIDIIKELKQLVLR